jgi:hypothetical protein
MPVVTSRGPAPEAELDVNNGEVSFRFTDCEALLCHIAFVDLFQNISKLVLRVVRGTLNIPCEADRLVWSLTYGRTQA